MVLFLIEAIKDIKLGGFSIIYIIPLVFSLFLFVLTIIKSKDNYLKIENCILSIITIPVVYFFLIGIIEFDFEFGAYLLNISFAVLYIIAVLKVFILKDVEDRSTSIKL
ncbi:MAG: hypothetical protein ABFS32_21950 [Bacteroidota bacterium]